MGCLKMSSSSKRVSQNYYSNCLIEVAKAKIKNPKIKIYFCRMRVTENGHLQKSHFMWSDGKYSYDFTDLENGHDLGFFGVIWYLGYLRKFDKNFAKEYSEYRNRTRFNVLEHFKNGNYRKNKK